MKATRQRGSRTTRQTVADADKVPHHMLRWETPDPPGPAPAPPAESNFLSVTTWTIVEKSDKYEKVDARTIHFEVEVPANGKKTMSYTVRYTW